MKKALILLIASVITLTATAQQSGQKTLSEKQEQRLGQDKPELKLWYNQPATCFEEALPIGNGKLGAMIYGGAEVDSIYLNDITMWSGKPFDKQLDKDAHQWLPAVREALFKEDYKLADSLQLHLQGHNSQFYRPLAQLYITDNDLHKAKASNYKRSLSLDNSIYTETYHHGDFGVYSRTIFASNPDRLIAIKLKAHYDEGEGLGRINNTLRMSAIVPHETKAEGKSITVQGRSDEDENSIHFYTKLIVQNKDGEVKASGDSLVITDASEVVIYIINETNFKAYDIQPDKNNNDYIDAVNLEAQRLEHKSFESIMQRHTLDYKQIFNRFNIMLNNASEPKDIPTGELLKRYNDQQNKLPSDYASYLEMLYTQYGRYLLISCSRTEGVPANLQGLWAVTKDSPWRGNYTVNINLEENYWPAEVANMQEMTAPLNGFIKALADNGQSTARNYYNVQKGWCSSHNSDIWAMTNPVGEKREWPEWSNWNMGGAWLVEALWEHFLFSMDKDYLRSTAYPLMKGAAEFCLEWLIKNPKNKGELITAPSTSPENEYITDKGYNGQTCYGGTADLAIIRELFQNTSAACEILGTDKQLKSQIDKALKKLRPYHVGKCGNLMEWYHDWEDKDWHHRHQSHLIGLYPGQQYEKMPVTAKSNFVADKEFIATSQQDFLNACEKTLEIKGDQSTGWSTGWRINLWARLMKGDTAYHYLQKLLTDVDPRNPRSGTYPNLFDAHPPFQIDGNFGGTAGVCEMLVQSSYSPANGTVIKLLPALPKAWKSGKVEGIRTRGGYTVFLEWENSKVKSCIILDKDGKIVDKNNEKNLKIVQ